MFTVVKPTLSRHFPGRGGLVGGHAGPIENGAPEALPLVNLIQGFPLHRTRAALQTGAGGRRSEGTRRVWESERVRDEIAKKVKCEV